MLFKKISIRFQIGVQHTAELHNAYCSFFFTMIRNSDRNMMQILKKYHNFNFTDKDYLRLLILAKMCTLRQIINNYNSKELKFTSTSARHAYRDKLDFGEGIMYSNVTVILTTVDHFGYFSSF